jgi:cytochrome c oxidase cbb3-type subunit 4
MDINDFRSAITAILMFAFIGLCIWAWGKGRKKDFDASAALPLEEDKIMSNNERESI